jgi:opacity protein-like surface antigen
MTSLRVVRVLCLAALTAVLSAVPALAQTGGRLTAGISFGAQTRSGDFTQRLTPTIYEETATVDIAQNYESGGLFDIGGEALIFGDLGVGIHFTRTAGDGTAAIAARIPDRLFFDRLRAATGVADGLDHTENAVHVQVLYRFAATPKIDVTVGLGPTFFSVKQELINSVDVIEPTPSITPQVVEASDSPVGVNVGADITYMVTERVGAGVLLRYAAGSADLTTPGGGAVSLDAGGFQFAAGVRVRF